MKHTLTVIEGRFENGETFKITAYTWKDKSKTGRLCYDVYFNNVIESVNVPWIVAQAILTEQMRKYIVETLEPVQKEG